MLAYIEILDVLKNELYVREEDLKEYGLDFDIEKGWFRVVDDSGEDYLYPPEKFVIQSTSL